MASFGRGEGLFAVEREVERLKMGGRVVFAGYRTGDELRARREVLAKDHEEKNRRAVQSVPDQRKPDAQVIIDKINKDEAPALKKDEPRNRTNKSTQADRVQMNRRIGIQERVEAAYMVRLRISSRLKTADLLTQVYQN